MIVSELCSNGDLFDYIRNVNAPSLYRVVCYIDTFVTMPTTLTVSVAPYHA